MHDGGFGLARWAAATCRWLGSFILLRDEVIRWLASGSQSVWPADCS